MKKLEQALGFKLKSVRGRKGWYVADFKYAKGPFDTADYSFEGLEQLALDALPIQKEFGVIIVAGSLEHLDWPKLYVINNRTPLELVKDFKVGTHKNFSENNWRAVQKDLSAVYKVIPFQPYLIDCAGYKARFERRITQDEALQITKLINDGFEAYEGDFDLDYEDEDVAKNLGERWLAEMAKVIHKENGIRLWWD